jgi:hypothetical protein
MPNLQYVLIYAERRQFIDFYGGVQIKSYRVLSFTLDCGGNSDRRLAHWIETWACAGNRIGAVIRGKSRNRIQLGSHFIKRVNSDHVN